MAPIFFLSSQKNSDSYTQWYLRFNKVQNYLCFADNAAAVQRDLVALQGRVAILSSVEAGGTLKK